MTLYTPKVLRWLPSEFITAKRRIPTAVFGHLKHPTAHPGAAAIQSLPRAIEPDYIRQRLLMFEVLIRQRVEFYASVLQIECALERSERNGGFLNEHFK